MRLICCHVKQVSQLSTVQTLLVWHVSARHRHCQCVQQAQCDLAVLLLTTTSADERSPAAAVVIHSRVLMMNCDCQPATQHDHVVSFSSWRRHWMTEARDAMEADQFAYQLAEELKQIVSTNQSNSVKQSTYTFKKIDTLHHSNGLNDH